MAVARRHNAILFIGLNPDAPREVQELRRSGSQVLFVGTSQIADRIMIDGKPFDLATAGGRRAMLATLKLSDYQANIINPILADAYRNSRDELGRLALIWASTDMSCRIAS
jgi:hypothetical protein